MKKVEARKFKADFEIRQNDEGNVDKIIGYAAVTDSEAPEVMGFIERIEPGAFENAIGKSDVRALFNHDSNYILGRKSAGTLTLIEDENGLFYEIDPPNTSYANDLLESLSRGDIDESSFGFTVKNETWDDSGDIPVRTIVEVEELYDVGPVTRGWYPQSESGLKSKSEVLQEFRNMKNDENCKAKEELERYKYKLKSLERCK